MIFFNEEKSIYCGNIFLPNQSNQTKNFQLVYPIKMIIKDKYGQVKNTEPHNR